MTTKTKITIDHVSTDTLHPLYAQYGGQVTAQPSYVELDLDSGNLSADYSGEIGNGIPERIWNGRATRFDVDCHLTAHEINDLLDEIAPLAQEWIDARVQSEPGLWGQGKPNNDAGFKIQQLCEGRTTESGGVWDAQTWVEADGHNPALHEQNTGYGIDLRHDSTDEELGEIAEILRGTAEEDGPITLDNLDGYLIDQREILRAKKGIEVSK